MWAPDGQRLFYRTERQLVAATFSVTPTFAVTSRKVVLLMNWTQKLRERVSATSRAP